MWDTQPQHIPGCRPRRWVLLVAEKGAGGRAACRTRLNGRGRRPKWRDIGESQRLGQVARLRGFRRFGEEIRFHRWVEQRSTSRSRVRPRTVGADPRAGSLISSPIAPAATPTVRGSLYAIVPLPLMGLPGALFGRWSRTTPRTRRTDHDRSSRHRPRHGESGLPVNL